MTSVPSRRWLVVALAGLLALTGLLVPAGLLAPAGGVAPAGTVAGQEDAGVTFVEDDVTESTTWTPGEGPYRVAADVTVREGATLTIRPGTTVQPAGDVTITVRGNLTANGTADEPITFAPAPGAPEDVRWGSIRYDGTPQSSLSLSHAAITDARNGVTVTSSDGTVTVDASTIRDVAADGVRVAGTDGTPRISVTDSTFTGVGGRGVAISPGSGAIADSRITPNASKLDHNATHDVSVTPRADTTVRTLRFEYSGYGDVTRVDRTAIRRFGIDADGDGSLDRLLNSSIASIDRRGSDAFSVTLDRPVTVAAGETLVANYTNVTNPRTYGTYPVELRLQARGVDQIAPTALALTLGTSPDARHPARDDRPGRASWFRIEGSTFESIEGQGVFVASDAAAYFGIEGNEFADVRGTGVTVRGSRIYSGRVDRNRLDGLDADADGVRLRAQRLADVNVRHNRIAGVDAGIALATRDDGLEGVRVASNAVTDSATGLRVDAGTTRRPTHVSMAVADNEFSENRRHGIAVTGPHARLTGVDVRGNDLTANGRAGLRVDARQLGRSTLANNTVADNGRTGVAFVGRQVRGTEIVDNEITDNGRHGMSIRTDLLVHDVSVDANRVLDNAGVGLDLRNRLTHAGNLTLARNTVAANAYGVRVAGSLDARVRNNVVAYNTYGIGEPAPVRGYEPGTGIVVENGDAGALFEAEAVGEELSYLIDDSDADDFLPRYSDEPYAVVLRPGDSGSVRREDGPQLSVRSVSTEIPTGIALSDDDGRSGATVAENDVYGHERGLVVNVSSLVDANTTRRLLVDATRTVTAERNYWGAPDGPAHASIHPEGTGDAVVTRRGWVDFLPIAESAHGPRYHRPNASLTVAPDPGRPGEPVVVSGRRSADRDGTVATYGFEVDGRTRTTADANLSTSFDAAGNYSVSLVVEDEMGVESATRAQRTIAVREPPETTEPSPGTTTADDPATTAPTTDQSTTTTTGASTETDPLASLFGSVGGLLGLALYGGGLALGAYGTLQTFYASVVTVSGRTINGLAAGGVLTWIGAGLLGTDGLLAVGVGAGVLWLGLAGLLWLAVRVAGQ